MNHQPPCWDVTQVTRAVKPDAEEIEDHLFRAIHSHTRLQISETVGSPTISATTEEFVSRFMDPKRNYVQAVVLGDSGTGKSHLIQWLRLHIPDDVHTVKLTIPKTGTSLRGIVERLIQELPDLEQQQFAIQLGETGSQLTNQNAKIDLFLNALAWSIEHGSRSVDNGDDDLRQLLPAVFMDPYLRKVYFHKDGSTVDQLVKHIFEPPDARGPEAIRQFTEDDLPLSGNLYEKIAGTTKDAIDFIKCDAKILPKAILLMNSCLESAISQALNFSADKLIELMSALRRHLERQGKRLILLIEDFARLQGIDTALLQALITPPGQGADRLCEIRWAMAVTTGYFQRLDATVRTRANIVVDMDTSVPTSIDAMTANYLNAVRVGEKRLLETDVTEEIFNACTTCNIRDSCFATFGEVNKVGLFPFTRRAISIFAERTGAMTNDKFNPRRYLRTVIEPVLLTHYTEIERGEFPSTELLDSLGGARNITPANRAVITDKDGDDLGERRIALLELWEGSGKLVNLPENLQLAFGIPPLRDLAESKEPEDGEVKFPPVMPSPKFPHIKELQDWESKKAILSSPVVNPLRNLVFASVESYIDWDALGFKKTDIASASGGGSIPFKRTSINFHAQQTHAVPTLVTLTLPLDPNSTKDWRDTALALQALVMFERQKNWEFEDAQIMLPILLEMLEKWAKFVRDEILKLYACSKDWNHAAAAAELLALGFQQRNRSVIEVKVDSLIRKLWESREPEQMENLTPNWGQINKKILRNWGTLQEIIRGHCSGTKGGQVGNYVNPLVVMRAVRSLRLRSLKLVQEPPSDLKIHALKELAELYREVKDEYLIDLNSERKAWIDWNEKTNENLGVNITFAQLLPKIKEAISQFESSGLVGGIALTQLKIAIEAINIVGIDRTRGVLKTIELENSTEVLLNIAFAAKLRASIDDLISKLERFLIHAEASVNTRLAEEVQTAGPGLEQSRETIKLALNGLVSTSKFIQEATEDKT